MKQYNRKWFYLFFLALVWGSSFILIKKSLIGLTPIQLGALRIIFAGIFLFVIGFKSIKLIERQHWKWIFVSGLFGTFLPAFLFAYAINNIDSSVASILNSTTPFNTLWIGGAFFGTAFSRKQITGVLLGLLGTALLIYSGSSINQDQNYWFALLPIIGSFGYALNVNVIKRYLSDLNPIAITVGSFVIITLPAFFILLSTNFFTSLRTEENLLKPIFYIFSLAIFGTGIAKIVFNKLIHTSSTIFAASVTYLIPLVAVVWGVIDGETLTLEQVLSGFVILLGVWLVNKAN